MSVLRDDLQKTEKQVIEKVRLTFNFGADVPDYVNVASIVDVDATKKGDVSGSTALIVTSVTYNGQKVTAYFDAGTNNETYYPFATVIMTNGEELKITAELLVKDKP